MIENAMYKAHNELEHLWGEEVMFLNRLVQFKSTLGNESEIQHFIENYLKKELNMNTDLFIPDPERLTKYENFGVPEWNYEGRPVVVGELNSDGSKTGKSLILQGHIDVVSAEPEHIWSHSPYEPYIEGNKMFGRGVVDMKAGVTAMIFAVKAIQKAGIKLGANIQIQSVIEEECTGNGALAILDRGYRAEGAIIPEPTDLKAQATQLGVIWMRVKVTGMGAHVEKAQDAQNAIEKACYLISEMGKYREYVNSLEKHIDYQYHEHPLNVNVGVIRGGDWPSNVPAECYFDVRVGFYPDRDPIEVKQEVKDWLLKASKKDEWLKDNEPEFTFFGFNAKGAKLNITHDLFTTLSSAHRAVTEKQIEYRYLTATTDVRVFEEFGIPCTCYGPSGGNLHGADEFLELDSLKTATKTLIAFILKWCNVNKQ